jgi:hypothetical protein
VTCAWHQLCWVWFCCVLNEGRKLPVDMSATTTVASPLAMTWHVRQLIAVLLEQLSPCLVPNHIRHAVSCMPASG